MKKRRIVGLLCMLAMGLILSLGPYSEILGQAPRPPPERFERGVLAVRRSGRYRLIHVPVGTEGQEMARRKARGEDVIRLRVVGLSQDPDEYLSYFPMILKGWSSVAISDRWWDLQWGPPVIGMDARQRNGPWGATLAVIDNGWDYTLDDQPNLVAGRDIVYGDDDPSPVHWHGTHVSSIALALHNELGIAGICPRCQLMPVRVCAATFCNETDIAHGVDWAVAHGATVINMSIGGLWPMPYLEQSLQDAAAQDVVLVAARGNGGSATPMYPASYEGVIAVSAVTSTLGLAEWSSYGEDVDFAAPGEDIFAGMGPGDSYGFASGTSMASPHVAAVVGLVQSACPAWVRSQIYDFMAASATDLGPEGKDIHFGWGLINAAAALELSCP